MFHRCFFVTRKEKGEVLIEIFGYNGEGEKEVYRYRVYSIEDGKYSDLKESIAYRCKILNVDNLFMFNVKNSINSCYFLCKVISFTDGLLHLNLYDLNKEEIK